MDSMFNAVDQNDKKELVDRVKDLELKFQQHVSESKAERKSPKWRSSGQDKKTGRDS